jgi:hypothetical protein
VSEDFRIYVDGGQPATLNDGAGTLTYCPTLQGGCVGFGRGWRRRRRYERPLKSSAVQFTPPLTSGGFTTGRSRRDTESSNLSPGRR